jgi:hypothetical protein
MVNDTQAGHSATALWAVFHEASWVRRALAWARFLFLLLTGQLALVSEDAPPRRRAPRRIVVRRINYPRAILPTLLQALRSPPRVVPT